VDNLIRHFIYPLVAFASEVPQMVLTDTRRDSKAVQGLISNLPMRDYGFESRKICDQFGQQTLDRTVHIMAIHSLLQGRVRLQALQSL
jgi:hypothetical protein